MTEKRYSFVGATRVAGKEVEVRGQKVHPAQATVIGFLAADPVVRTMKDGRKVLNMSVPLENTGRKINGAVGLDGKAPETLWLRASIFDSEHIPSATRAEKLLKKGMLVVLNGQVNVEEYNGDVQYNMNVDDFKISWSKEKGKTVGGDYSFAYARKANKEGSAILGFEGFIGTEPEAKVTGSGQEVLSFRVALNKAGKKLNFPLGIQAGAEDVTWVTVNVWNNDGYPLKTRAEKVLKKGMAIVGHGMLTANQGDKGYFYNLNLNDFEVMKSSDGKQAVGAGAQASAQTFESYGNPVDMLDDDLPF